MTNVTRIMVPVFAALALLPRVISAAEIQVVEEGPKVGLNGLSFEAGVALPDKGDAAFLYGGRLYLGNLFTNWLHFSAGLTRWNTNLDPKELAQDVAGEISDTRVFGALQAHLFTVKSVATYAGAGLALHRVGASIAEDPDLEDAIKGTKVAPEFSLALALPAGAFELGTELRREIVEDADNWSIGFLAGIHWSGPRKRGYQAEQEAKLKVDATSSAKTPVPTTIEVNTAPTEVAVTPPAPPTTAPKVEVPEPVRDDLREVREENAELKKRLEQIEERERDRALNEERARREAAEKENARLAAELQAALASTQKKADATATDVGLSSGAQTLLLTFSDSVMFSSGTADLSAGAVTELGRVAQVLRAHPGATIVIEGHTDSAGNPVSNQELSQRRADSVKSALVAAGIAGSRIETIGAGSSRPIADNTTASGRAMNRRVEIQIRPAGVE
ncbi:MAG: OmpA family protein [bacterium]